MKSVRRPRRLVLLAAAAGLAVGLGGCSYSNPMQTHDFYQAGDGTNSDPDGVGVRNAVLVVGENGDGQVYMTVANETEQDAEVTLEGALDGTPLFRTDASVPAGGVVRIGAEGDQQLPVSGTDAAPGDIVQLTITSGEASSTISMPVMDASIPYYGSSDEQGTGPSDGGGESATGSDDGEG